MALAKKCDRCGKMYEHYPKGIKSQCNAIRRAERAISGELINSCAYPVHDLCPDCMASFGKWMTDIKFGDEVGPDTPKMRPPQKLPWL